MVSEETVEQTVEPVAPAGENAASPPAEVTDEAPKRSLAELVRAKIVEAASGTSAREEQSAGSPPAASEHKEKLPPFHQHPRWREVQDELRKARREAEEAKSEIERLKSIARPLLEGELDQETVERAIELAKKLREDPRKIVEELAPEVERAAIAAGEKLPEDLEREVDEGLITPERAKELARLRLEIEGREAALKAAQAQTVQARLRDVAGAVSERERQLLATDPDYAKVRPIVTRLYEHAVRTALDRGQDILDKAWALETLERVTSEVLTLMRGARSQPAVPPPPTTKSRTATTVDRPKTLADLVKREIEQWSSRKE